MGNKTGISWTDATWNPVTGCTRVSEGCRNCYAESLAATRLKESPRYSGLAAVTPSGPRWTGKINLHPELLHQPISWRKPRRIFVNSMSDLFHPDVRDSFVDEIVATMAVTPWHTYQILTKRAGWMRSYFSNIPSDPYNTRYQYIFDAANVQLGKQMRWPLPNVWLGVSAEDQAAAEDRIPELLETPAAIRFVSCEPMLDAIDLTNLCVDGCHRINALEGRFSDEPTLDWVIAGGESGTNARPFYMEWAGSIRDQCKAAGVAFFMKQLGANPYDDARPATTDEHPYAKLYCKSRNGSDPAEWPEDMRVQEFPR